MTSPSCATTRRELLRGIDRVSGASARHLASCAECGFFAERFAAARDGLRGHHAGAVPDAAFAARVTAALPVRGDSVDAVSWAALRLLPAALATALLLGVWCWLATSSPTSLAESPPSQDVLSWVLDDGA